MQRLLMLPAMKPSAHIGDGCILIERINIRFKRLDPIGRKKKTHQVPFVNKGTGGQFGLGQMRKQVTVHG